MPCGGFTTAHSGVRITRKKKSTTRNEGFQTFRRPSRGSRKIGAPDVQNSLDCGLF